MRSGGNWPYGQCSMSIGVYDDLSSLADWTGGGTVRDQSGGRWLIRSEGGLNRANQRLEVLAGCVSAQSLTQARG
jgi:hypothetical protein